MTRHSYMIPGLALALSLPATAVGQGLPHTFTSGTPARAGEVNENFRYVAPENIVHVNPVQGGTASDNGDALEEALNADNLAAINGAPSASNPYLIKIAPGIYDVGSETLRLLGHVDVMGSGSTSVIRGSATSVGVVRAATNSTLSFVRVEAVSGGRTAIAAQLASGARIAHVDARVSGSSATGTAIRIEDRSTVVLESVTATVTGSTTHSVGLVVEGGTAAGQRSEVTASNVAITLSHDGGIAAGVLLRARSRFSASNLRVEATSSEASYGLNSFGSDIRAALRDSVLEVTGGATEAYPIQVENAGTTLEVHHSVLTNHSHDDFLNNSTGSTVRIAASQTAPNASWVGNGTTKCAYVYDEGFDEVSCTNLQ